MGVSAEAASIIPRDNPTKRQKSQAITPRLENKKRRKPKVAFAVFPIIELYP